ncbi:hypothetical protein ACLOJK_024063, partial [Asimina triloba]
IRWQQGGSEWGGVGQRGESKNSVLVAGMFGLVYLVGERVWTVGGDCRGEQQVGLRHLKEAHSAIVEFGGPFGSSELRLVGRANSGQAG